MTSNSTASVRSLRFWWRVTRYDPALRDERGAYPDDAWTSISDVGQVFQGHKLTLPEYERVEAAYVSAFVAFAEESNVERLQVRSLESGDDLGEGETMSVAEAGKVVRRMLREDVICKLESPVDDFALHVGFDLYMYVGSMRPCPRAAEVAAQLGLFVEDNWPSPQIVEEE